MVLFRPGAGLKELWASVDTCILPHVSNITAYKGGARDPMGVGGGEKKNWESC